MSIKINDQCRLAPASCSAAGLATELTELTNKYIELGLSPEQAASVFAHAADSALDCLKWEPMITRIAHEKIKESAMLLKLHWSPKPPNRYWVELLRPILVAEFHVRVEFGVEHVVCPAY